VEENRSFLDSLEDFWGWPRGHRRWMHAPTGHASCHSLSGMSLQVDAAALVVGSVNGECVMLSHMLCCYGGSSRGSLDPLRGP